MHRYFVSFIGSSLTSKVFQSPAFAVAELETDEPIRNTVQLFTHLKKQLKDEGHLLDKVVPISFQKFEE
ncbi:MAG: hypothetical protein HYY92_00750 [Parcubacteria group bacterium]|nr:hypothetical protein [Parcubacteria group bacterium]